MATARIKRLPLPADTVAGDPLGKMPTSKRQQLRAIDTRRAIIAAALSVFAENGFAGASTRVIADHAGVPQPLLLYHFQSKDALWKEVANYIFSEIARLWDERVPVTATMTAVEKVRIEFRALFEFTVRHPALHRFLTWENRAGSERLTWIVDNYVKDSMQRTVSHIVAAQAAGDLPSGDPKLFHYYLISASCALSWLAPEIEIATDSRFDDPVVVEGYWSLIERTIFGSIKSPTGSARAALQEN